MTLSNTPVKHKPTLAPAKNSELNEAASVVTNQQAKIASKSAPRSAHECGQPGIDETSKSIRTSEPALENNMYKPIERWLSETAKEEYWHTESRT
ncbi:hypothetical protein BU16DRAFT_561705 [Lophium mytilinum]|uniref:Uncharacterized protein n=1 Tax=Lophium mytilinum TaxID=390894 RepID=A0A6A6QSP8_9PEZI|nr:hypothetical protein BU16DRAFT_561705 [Lophium mytilinum]